MKWGFFFIILSFFISCAQFERVPSSVTSEDLHVVFDIDWTLVSNFEEGVTVVNPKKIIWVEGKPYVPRAGIVELIEYLISKNIQISFFSGGSEKRNIELLSKIKLPYGRSLKDIAYKILSFNDLTIMPDVPENSKFAERYKKDLLKITTNLENVILIDDNANFYLNETQKLNMINLGPTYNYYEKFEDIKLKAGEYIPKSFAEWDFDHKKFYIILNQIHEALNYMNKNPQISFKSAMNSLKLKLNFESGTWNRESLSLMNVRHEKKLPVFLPETCHNLVLPFIN